MTTDGRRPQSEHRNQNTQLCGQWNCRATCSCKRNNEAFNFSDSRRKSWSASAVQKQLFIDIRNISTFSFLLEPLQSLPCINQAFPGNPSIAHTSRYQTGDRDCPDNKSSMDEYSAQPAISSPKQERTRPADRLLEPLHNPLAAYNSQEQSSSTWRQVHRSK
jgi:hypothetical protein